MGASLVSVLDWLPYHQAIVEHLQQVDPFVWNWFVKTASDPKASDEVRLDLLKSTYRVDRSSQGALYEAASAVAAQLKISAPVTIYQAQNPVGLNASLAYVPGEIHLVLHGPIVEKLTPSEVRALFGHELTHYLLWQERGGELLVADEVLRALAGDSHAHPAHFASLRLLRLYNEVLCDRGSYLVTQDLNSVVSMLVKVQTGIQEVSAEGYLQQADEILSRGPVSTDGITHPEAFIRARAVKLWSESSADANAAIVEMIEGRPGIDELDLLAQQRLSAITRRILDALFVRKWFQTDVVLAHARLFFEDYTPPLAAASEADLATLIQHPADTLRDYFCFLLLDFAAADRELDEAPLAAALLLSDELAIKSRFMEIARRELRLRKNQLEKIDERKLKILADAERLIASEP